MDLGTYLRFALALVFVLALIVALAWLMRRFGLAGAIGGRRGGHRKRLGLVETLAIDAKRRLILVRRDDAEHLILIGGEHDLLVEGGIGPAPAVTDGAGAAPRPVAATPSVGAAPPPSPAKATGPLGRLRADPAAAGPAPAPSRPTPPAAAPDGAPAPDAPPRETPRS